MKTPVRILALAALTLALGACSTAGSKPLTAEAHDKDATQAAAAAPAPTAQPDLSQPRDTSVQVFNLDGPAPAPAIETAAAAPQSVSPSYAGVPYSGGDQSVTVFPIDSGPGSPSVADELNPSSSPSSSAPAPAMWSNWQQGAQPAPMEPLPQFAAAEPQSQGQGWNAAAGQPASINGVQKIFFANGSANINAAGQQVIASVADAHGGAIRVEGHASPRADTTDPLEKRLINLDMSMKRAMTVSRALIMKGVPATDIKTTAWGDSIPPQYLDPGMSAEAAARRVEIFTKP